MHETKTIREEVIARLMCRHGLSIEEAASVWDVYTLWLVGTMRGVNSSAAIQDN